MIEINHLSFTYADSARPVLDNVSLTIAEGELVAVAGRTGSGKSTLLGTLNGLVPHFTGGHLEGDVRVDGLSIRSHPPRDLAHLVGVVGQDPLAGFVTDIVEDELAYGMEQLGVRPHAMRRRVEETLDLLGIAELRTRALRTLSGGQQQRVAIGSVLTMAPRVLVLDEPTSALDPTAAEDVLATLSRLCQDLGTTVVLAEHRLERVLPFADQLIVVPGDGSVTIGDPAEQAAELSAAPPIVELARLANWTPIPLSIREARRYAAPLRERLGRASRTSGTPICTNAVALTARGIQVRYGSTVAVKDIDLRLIHSEVTALMGRNGSGKSSLLWALQGSGPRQEGTVDSDGGVGLVPQTASDVLYLETVAAECDTADRDSGAGAGTCSALLSRLAPGVDPTQNPRDLSEGQKLALVLAIQLTAAPEVVLLDEPTRGLDYAAKAALALIIGDLAAAGRAVVVATHDVEFVATIAHRTIIMADGEVVADDRTPEILCSSPAFAPQVTKILGGQWLTVDQVRRDLGPVRNVSQVETVDLLGPTNQVGS